MEHYIIYMVLLDDMINYGKLLCRGDYYYIGFKSNVHTRFRYQISIIIT
jgi:hypothetical protein